MLDKEKVYYFASPYSHIKASIVNARYKEQQRLVAHLIKEFGLNIINPIEMCHNMQKRYDLPSGYDFWMIRDRKLISISNAVIVALMPGWKESKGVTDEIAYAMSLGRAIYYLDPNDLTISDAVPLFSSLSKLKGV